MWTAERPHLYTLVISTHSVRPDGEVDEGSPLQCESSRVGFRKVFNISREPKGDGAAVPAEMCEFLDCFRGHDVFGDTKPGDGVIRNSVIDAGVSMLLSGRGILSVPTHRFFESRFTSIQNLKLRLLSLTLYFSHSELLIVA